MNNKIDLGKIYGFTNCARETLPYSGNIAPNIPTLEEIANYNLLNEDMYIKPQENKSRNNKIISNKETGRDISNDGLSRNYIQAENGSQFTLTPKLDNDFIRDNSNNQSDMIPVYNQPYPVTGESIQYLNGFMRTQIGRRVEVEFLIGSDDLVIKQGYLLGVGANYILLNELGTSNLTSCDFYNIKFVTFFYD